jgi:hypothetical protein
MIYFFTPYIKNDLGQAYNHYCNLVPNDDDWITFVDGDIMQLHLDWGEKWTTILNQNDNAGIVTCMTNRITPFNKEQRVEGMYDETDILKHKQYSLDLFQDKKFSVKQMTDPNHFSGFFFSFKKRTWREAGGFIPGILKVDSTFYKKVLKLKKSCLVAEGFYVLHYYRLLEGFEYTDHLKVSDDATK